MKVLNFNDGFCQVTNLKFFFYSSSQSCVEQNDGKNKFIMERVGLKLIHYHLNEDECEEKTVCRTKILSTLHAEVFGV
jgi:hypothetical protein